jgi:putative ATP-dependent endonuclease of OLD family
VKNYRALKHADVRFSQSTNVIVGNNEAGKSTLLEAINLALKCQLNRRPAQYELHPFLINQELVREYVAAVRAKKPVAPPEASIEIYFNPIPEVGELRGSINSLRSDEPGISLTIRLREELREDYNKYIADLTISSVPIEYYEISWQTFAGSTLTSHSVPLKSVLVDPSNISNTQSANKYVIEVVKDYLTKAQSVHLALAYRGMRETFHADDRIAAINSDLEAKRGLISEKVLSVSLDTTSRVSWETGVLPHLDGIPLSLAGKGEQNSVKIKLAIEASEKCSMIFIEEPENHLSHTNLGRLIGNIADRCKDKQVILTTHSSFVLNKLGIDKVIMFNGKEGITLDHLPKETKSFFQRLPGHDTLRMMLASRTILVEGPSDELIVQRAFRQKHGKLPLEAGVEVISVGTSFKRFLDIAKLLGLRVAIVRDNDGKPDEKKALFKDYDGIHGISIHIDADGDAHTLEPQLVKANGLSKLNEILGTSFKSDKELSDHMISNKTECALKIFEHADAISIPAYIQNAIG